MVQRYGARPRERRSARRFARRAQVRYWVHGEDQPRHAFIHDISTSGLFIATPYPLPRDTEIRVEISDKGTTYTVEAVVARRAWIAPDLRRLGPTGMGARFLAPDELVARLRERGLGRAAGEKQGEDRFRVVLEDDRGLLQLFARDLEMGGLFIPTDAPPPLNREVHIAFHFPGVKEPFALPARVVQRVPAGQAGNGLQAGMAVVFDDAQALLERLRPYLEPGAVGPAAAPSGTAVAAAPAAAAEAALSAEAGSAAAGRSDS